MEALLLDLAYARLAVADPRVSARFAEQRFGLQKAAERDGQYALRAGPFAQVLSFFGGVPGEESIGLEIGENADLDGIIAKLTQRGFAARRASTAECEDRLVHDAVFLRDASGNHIELVTRPMQTASRFFPAHDAGVRGLQGFGLRSTDMARDLLLWTELLGARITDRVGEIAYLAFDAAHHRIALYPSRDAGLLYAAFAVESFDDIMRNMYFLSDHQVKILQGPGRLAVSDEAFLHLQGPEGRIYTYVHGGSALPAQHRPRQFPRDAASLCAWGSVCAEIPELAPAESGKININPRGNLP